MSRIATGRTTPAQILSTVSDFHEGRQDLRAFLDRSEEQIGDLADEPGLDIGLLEDLWTEIEIIYAIASAEGREQLGDAEARSVLTLLDQFATVLRAPTQPDDAG